MADSAMMREAMPTVPRYGRLHPSGVASAGGVIAFVALITPSYSYRLSGSSGCFRSHNGRRLATVGMVAKLYAGGGELTDHSRVHASQGSFPATSPFQYEMTRFATNTRTAMP